MKGELLAMLRMSTDTVTFSGRGGGGGGGGGGLFRIETVSASKLVLCRVEVKDEEAAHQTAQNAV
jgi:hypothetical protein